MVMKKFECVHCEDEYEEDEGIHFKNEDSVGFICETCECEADWSIRIEYLNFQDDEVMFENDEGFEVLEVNDYNKVSSEFKSEYKRLDGWRGYSYPAVRDGASLNWVEVVSDNILSMSEDAEQLKILDSAMVDFVKEQGIPMARIYSRSSNVFSTGYDLFIPEEHLNTVKKFVESLKEKYRSDARYFNTVATGE